MRRLILIPAIALATAAFAHQGVKDPQVMARMELMKAVAGDMKVLGQMAKGVTAFDKAKMQARGASLAAHADDTIRLFEPPATDPKSEALPAIWTSFPDFTARAQEMAQAAKVVEASSETEFEAAFIALAKTCGNCHKSYRMEN